MIGPTTSAVISLKRSIETLQETAGVIGVVASTFEGVRVQVRSAQAFANFHQEGEVVQTDHEAHKDFIEFTKDHYGVTILYLASKTKEDEEEKI